jgi:CheY-like chemotaxis protein
VFPFQAGDGEMLTLCSSQAELKVIIVDDNAKMRSLIRALLSERAHEFGECSDGREAHWQGEWAANSLCRGRWAAIAKAILRLLTAKGYATRFFGSAHEFMENYEPGTAGCLVLDVLMPEMTGLDLQRWLAGAERQLPIIFLTGSDDFCKTDHTMTDLAVDELISLCGPWLWSTPSKKPSPSTVKPAIGHKPERLRMPDTLMLDQSR